MQGLLVKYGEIALRGKNRHIFENRLMDTIAQKVSVITENHKVKKEQGRLLIEARNQMDYDRLVPLVKNIIGVTYVCPCEIKTCHDIETLKQAATEYLRNNYTGNYTFKVLTKRSNKNYPLTSIEISAEVGGYIAQNITEATVDVINPQVNLHIELRNNVYIYSKIIKGVGGMPHVGGKALVLLSGGIDSPVAAFLTARRGVEIEAIYFHSPPYTSEHAKQKVIDLCERLKFYTGYVRLHVVNFTSLQLFLYNNAPKDNLTIFLKRYMLRIAAHTAKDIDAQAIVMGDSIGQVASQTIHSIAAIDAVGIGLPIIRPLATYDKQDIINIANEIETYPISVLPYEDCCTIFVAKHPTTKPRLSLLEKIESALQEELDKLLASTIEEIEIIEV
ncbi:MAG: tRNA 4-thiouridine(8) synthase ThiI [Defluviitaleaceae bacterium]|nr:tRNA 4-thiouridine(8) synthase ThiI [Defluviitaleaceae bacterium]